MDLSYFYGLGEIQAQKLWKRLHELKLVEKKDYNLNELRKILKNPKIFPELNESTRQDVLYYPLRKIPRCIISIIDSEFKKILGKLKIRYKIAGSYLRGKDTSSDIDMVLNKDSVHCGSVNIWDYIQELINKKSKILKLMKPFAQGLDKIGLLIKIDIKKINKLYPKYVDQVYGALDVRKNIIYVKMDIFITNNNEYVYALLFATGSGIFNVRMRAVAKRKGYLLNNRGLFKKNNNGLEKLPITTERGIFKALNMAYKAPKDRIK